jgi:hypothetical protein
VCSSDLVTIKKYCPRTIVSETMKILKVSKESEIYENEEFSKYIGSKEAKKIVEDLFKPKGPALSPDLLNNYDIDKTMHQWATTGTIKNKKFHALPYQMIDFAEQKTELDSLDIVSLINQNYDSFGVVLNTDVSSGRGKHWFCMYAELKNQQTKKSKGTKEDPIILEFFNSSGNPPREEISIWMEKTKADLFVNDKLYVEFEYPVMGKQIQKSDTECGMWALIYIWSRLMDKSSKFLLEQKTTDKEVIDARKNFFRV